MEDKIIDINETLVKAYVESIRPQKIEIRKKLDYDYSYDGKNFVIHEKRPLWNDPTKITVIPIAKLSHVKAQNVWKLYWMRSNEKWEIYPPTSSSATIEVLLKTIKEDSQSCFFG